MTTTGTDGSTDARLSRLEHQQEEQTASHDWLTGRFAALDGHLARLTDKVDEYGERLQRVEKFSEEQRDYARETRDLARETRDLQRDQRGAIEAQRTQLADLAKHSAEWVSTLPPGWRRVVALVGAAGVVILQALAAFRVDL